MPLIRYKVGDIGRKNPSATCSCGRGLESLLSIDGRDTDVVLTKNGNRLIVHFFTGIFEYCQTIDTFRILQDKVGEIAVEIVPRPGFVMEDWYKIRQQISEKGDPDMKILMKIVPEIPVGASNKRRFVISNVVKM